MVKDVSYQMERGSNSTSKLVPYSMSPGISSFKIGKSRVGNYIQESIQVKKLFNLLLVSMFLSVCVGQVVRAHTQNITWLNRSYDIDSSCPIAPKK